jgi:hypothetical protein
MSEMDRVGQIAAIGMTGTAGTALIQQEKRVDFLDIDISFGYLPFNLPIGNIVVLVGFCFSAYAFYKSRQYTKAQKRRGGDKNWPDSIVRDPTKKKR